MGMSDQTKSKMNAGIEHLKDKLKGIRTNRANPGLVETIMVDVYGSQVRIKEISSITVPESRQLVITPFDPNNKAGIAKAIERANLGFMPIVDGNVVRIRIPQMDEKVREEMKRLCHKEGEDAKVVIRNHRRDGNEQFRKQKKDGIIAEDELKRIEKEIQDLTDRFCKEIDGLVAKKEQEIATI